MDGFGNRFWNLDLGKHASGAFPYVELSLTLGILVTQNAYIGPYSL